MRRVALAWVLCLSAAAACKTKKPQEKPPDGALRQALWAVRIAEEVRGVALADDLVTLVTEQQVLGVSEGRATWNLPVKTMGWVVASPTGEIVTADDRGGVLVIDGSGTVIERLELARAGDEGVPLAAAGTASRTGVVLLATDGRVLYLERRRLDEIVRVPSDDLEAAGSLRVVGGLIFATLGTELNVVDPIAGRLFGVRGEFSIDAVATDGHVLALSLDDELLSLDVKRCPSKGTITMAPQKGEIAPPKGCVTWRRRGDLWAERVQEGWIFVVGDARLTALRDGREVWKAALQPRGRVASDGHRTLYVVGEGDPWPWLHAIDAETGSSRWSAPLPFDAEGEANVVVGTEQVVVTLGRNVAAFAR